MVRPLPPDQWPFATDEERAAGWAEPRFNRRRRSRRTGDPVVGHTDGCAGHCGTSHDNPPCPGMERRAPVRTKAAPDPTDAIDRWRRARQEQ